MPIILKAILWKLLRYDAHLPTIFIASFFSLVKNVKFLKLNLVASLSKQVLWILFSCWLVSHSHVSRMASLVKVLTVAPWAWHSQVCLCLLSCHIPQPIQSLPGIATRNVFLKLSPTVSFLGLNSYNVLATPWPQTLPTCSV